MIQACRARNALHRARLALRGHGDPREPMRALCRDARDQCRTDGNAPSGPATR
jgi:hypothetical protein